MQKWEYLRLINERSEDDNLFYWLDMPENQQNCFLQRNG